MTAQPATQPATDEVRAALWERYIKPTQRTRSHVIGIEIEMPVATLDGSPTRHSVAQQAFCAAVDHFGFEKRLFDVNGVCYNAVHPETLDDFSFDCSYNNLEISLGCVSDIHEANARFTKYVSFINQELARENHLLTGMGVNPNYQANQATYVETGRYGMLGAYLHCAREWQAQGFGPFHNYPSFGTFASASQVQLDVEEPDIPTVLKAFSLLEPLKAVLFANSVMEEEPDLLCVRDMLWEASTHGINPRNVGFYDEVPASSAELVDYIARASIFCTERDGHYLFFKPVPAAQYFALPQVQAWYCENGELTPYEFTPQPGDLEYLRTYKHADMTYRGTVEFRSCCCQPLSEAMTVAAFHVGLMARAPELVELLENNPLLQGAGKTPAEQRALLNRRDWQSKVNEDQVSLLCIQILNLCREGLVGRGLNEEEFLQPLFRRAETLQSPAARYVSALAEGIPVHQLVREYSL